MQTFMTFWTFFQTNIFTKPAFFMGIVVFVGYMVLRRPLHEAFAGFVKATVGYMIFNAGSTGLVNNFRPIILALNDKFHLAATVIDPYFGGPATMKAIEESGRSLSLAVSAMIIGFFFNILLVMFHKTTKIRSLMIGGHVMNMGSIIFTWVLLRTMPNLSDAAIIVMVGLLNGAYWATASNLTVEATQELTDGAGFAVGHAQMFGIWITSKIARFLGGKNKKSLENIKLPGFLTMLNDNVVASAVVMLIFFGTLILILGAPMMRKIDPSLAPNANFVVYIIEKTFNFSVYMSILMMGIRMFVAELSEAFQGISNKLLPGSMPAVDCAVTFGYVDPNILTVGFLFGALGSFLAIAGLVVFRSPILAIVGFIPMFFDNATLGAFANQRGGFRALVAVTMFTGTVHVIGGAACAYFYQTAKYGGWAGNFDSSAFWTLLGFILKNAGLVGYVATMAVLLAIPQIQYMRDRENYFKVVTDYQAYKETVLAKGTAD